jgi:hypothetical protein
MKSQSSIIALLLGSSLPTALGWGSLGHQTVAYVAQNFVTATTKTFMQGILDDTTTSYLANAATWADDYRYTTAGAFSYNFHFIDAQDDPPTTCDVDYDRDCASDTCIVSAITNYTSRIQSTTLDETQLLAAARFIIHFVGDIHQPLHDENLDVGGNTVDVTYDGSSTNLHHIWDTNMPEQYTGGYALSDAETWATTLTTAIKSGTYESDAAGWLDGIDLSDAQTTAMSWATDSNAFVCTEVMPNGISAVLKEDLSTTYYDAVMPTIKLQIAKAGYRLAAWLNLIATGETGL